MQRLGWIALLLIGLSSSIAQTDRDLTPVVFRPGWFASAQFAGVFVALEAGLYEEDGLDVEIRSFGYGQDATTNLNQDLDTCALGTIEGYILLQKLDGGDDLVALRPMLPQSPAGVMTFADSGILGAADFEGRRIGVHAYADPLFAWFARNAGLAEDQVEFVRVEDDLAVLVSGEVDAMQGYAIEEYVRLQHEDETRSTRFVSFADLGFPSYSEILYTTRAQHERHARTQTTFVDATRRGWELALARPELAAAAVLAHMPPETDSAQVAAALQALKPFVLDDGGEIMPAMDAERWSDLIRISREMGLVDGEIAPPDEWLR